jgi:hypothetical protein
VLPTLLPVPDLVELARLAASAPPGNFAEVGVYRGGSASLLYQIAEDQGRTLHLYDTFSGHPNHHHPTDNPQVHPPGCFSDAINPEQLQRLLPNAVIHVGKFPATLVDMAPLAFVHSDADLYYVTKAVCTLLPPMMVGGGQLYFDDYGHVGCEGVVEAVCEVFGQGPSHWNKKRLITL